MAGIWSNGSASAELSNILIKEKKSLLPEKLGSDKKTSSFLLS
uniref:Uncharacterized protein n=1 Tax=Rhizophora mucronata TaxID=61149 RepID=A0A2P2QID5_RHIMU